MRSPARIALAFWLLFLFLGLAGCSGLSLSKPQAPLDQLVALDRPYVRLALPRDFRLEPGRPEQAVLIVRATRKDQKALLELSWRPLPEPLDLSLLKTTLSAVERAELKKVRAAEDFSSVQEVDVGGLRGVAFDFKAWGLFSRRCLLPLADQLFVLTVSGRSAADLESLNPVLESLKFRPDPVRLADGDELSSELVSLSLLIASFSPPAQEEARRRLAQLRLARPDDPLPPALEVEAAALAALSRRIFGREEVKRDWESLSALARAAAIKRPGSALAHRALGLALTLSGRRPQGEAELALAQKILPGAAENFLAQAAVTVDPRNRIRLAAKALDHNPRLAGARLILAQSLFDQGYRDAAQDEYRQVLANDWFNTESLLGLAVCLLDQPYQAARAAGLLKKAIALDPEAVSPLFDLARLSFDQGEVKAAEQSVRAFLARKPADPAGLNLLGLILRTQGRFDEAAKAFEDALAVEPRHAPALYNLGALSAEEIRDLTRARQIFERFLAVEPSGTRAKQVRDFLAATDPSKPPAPKPPAAPAPASPLAEQLKSPAEPAKPAVAAPPPAEKPKSTVQPAPATPPPEPPKPPAKPAVTLTPAGGEGEMGEGPAQGPIPVGMPVKPGVKIRVTPPESPAP